MATTTNFGWETPDDSDLVKDGAAAMRTLGNSIDASMADLRGGTTGQILSKNSNTDMDFTWIANDQGDITAVTAGTGISGGGTSGAVTITNSMATEITAKGDLIVGTGNATFDNLAVGTNGHILTADSSTSTGLKWASASAAATSYTLLNSGGTSLTGATTTVSSLSGYNKLFIYCRDFSFAGATAFNITFNSDSGSNYYPAGLKIDATSSYGSTTTFTGRFGSADTRWQVGIPYNAANVGGLAMFIDGANSSGVKVVSSTIGYQGATDNSFSVIQGIWNNSAVLSSISFTGQTQNFDAGTAFIYGAN